MILIEHKLKFNRREKQIKRGLNSANNRMNKNDFALWF